MNVPAALRALAVAPLQQDGEPCVGLSDVLGIAPNDGRFACVLRRDEWAIARRFDGVLDANEIAARASAELGVALEVEFVTAIEERLARGLLLDDAAFRDAREHALDEDRALRERPPIGVGRDYPADAFELRASIGGMVADDWDMPPPEACFAAWTAEASLRVARAVHGRTWAALRHFVADFDRALVLAPLRAPLAEVLIALEKPLATPLGAVAPDARLLAELGPASAESQLALRTSLALERQALFLRVLLRDKPAAFALLRAPNEPAERELVLARLASTLSVPRTLLVVAADLAEEHRALAGPSHGASSDRAPTRLRPTSTAPRDNLWVVDADLDRSRDHDREFVDAATRVDGPALSALAASEHAPHRRDSIAVVDLALAALARVQPTARGSLLGYAQANDRGTLVSSASVLFH
ncbi:MAG: MEMO1 family protein [Planctomycetes bacterium]|nr:MEMO1 family protein [Planctomycetota bacterium]